MKKRDALLIVLLLLVMAVGGLLLRVVLFPANTFVRGVNVTYDVMQDTMTADNAIYNYEWFKEQEAHIRTCLKNEELAKKEYEEYISLLPLDRTEWTSFDRQEEASLRNSYSALQRLTNLAIEQYNARSEMANRNIFKDNLPSNISRAWYAGSQLITQ